MGDNIDYDAFIPKASIAWGSSFAIRHEDGKFFIKDLTTLGPRYQTMVRLTKEVQTPLKAGDVLSLAGSVVIGIE